ncbi:MAG: Gfo/Idh/MocA family oxidoreductase [Verrucomicrobia bacterium]|nr:Gfo/Idh/MocA family oxidoreductase [Verrucomicrobiota bacterium]
MKASSALVALPWVIPGSVLGKDGAVPPSERIVMGGIGIGNQGGGDQGAFLGRGDVQYVAVCDVKRAVREGSKSRIDQHYGDKGCTVYTDFRELLARPDLDAVHVATPDHWHAVIVTAACRAGKDVYCQKPESLTIVEGRAMVDTARRFNRIVSGGSQRVMEDYMGIVRKCWSGEIGTPKEVFVNCGGPSMPCYLGGEPVPEGLDWDMWLGPAPLAPYHPYRISGSFAINGTSWRSWRDYSGGSMTDWGAHHFGGMMFAVNKMEEGPVEIIPPDGKDHPYLTYRFADGMLLYHGSRVDVVGDGKPVAPREIPRYKGTGGIYGDFIESVRTREKPFRDIGRAHRTASICHLGNICYLLNRPLKWDPVKEEFPGDDQANRLRDRDRREPWTI